MKTHWTVQTNAKSEKNAQVLLNQISRQLQRVPAEVVFEGDRYCGHEIRFVLDDRTPGSRAEALYRLLMQAEQLGNSWVLGRISAAAHGWTTRSRVAGVQRLEWRELTDDGAPQCCG